MIAALDRMIAMQLRERAACCSMLWLVTAALARRAEQQRERATYCSALGGGS